MSIPEYTIQKPVWSEADFEQMGWHDVHVHAAAFGFEILEWWLDIDYIFSWVDPSNGQSCYSFWIAPATLVFETVYDLKMEIESRNGELSLQSIARDQASARNALPNRTEWRWVLEFNEGTVTFRSVGFSQFTRRPPILTQAQRLMIEQRGGISFDRNYVAS
jgi:hypothetical protein